MDKEVLESMKKQMQELNRKIVDLSKNFNTNYQTYAFDEKEQSISSISKSLTSSEILQDMVNLDNLERDLKSSMENLNISAINQEDLLEHDEISELQEQNAEKMEMTPEEISDFVDNENLEEKEEKSTEVITSKEQFIKEIGQVRSGTILRVDEKVVKQCIEKSISPKEKIKAKFKKIKTHLDEAKIYAKCILGASAIVSSIATPIVGENLDDIYASHLKVQEQKEYVSTIYEPNTISNLVKNEKNGQYSPVHRHNWEKIINSVHQQYENPLVSFYLIYTKLDEDCKKNDMDIIMKEFNLQYSTNYKGVGDLLEKNNFKDFREFAKYVDFEIYKMSAKEIKIEYEDADHKVGR